jgi:2-keto-4-pentenoate hydratase/2-oxohepta-3-ene-1,7-dioic acid hydratase in catechol pathway
VQNVPHTHPGNLISGVIERWSDLRAPIERTTTAGRGVPVSQVKIRPPLPKPVNVNCMAVNYMEDGTRKEPAPINAFHKSPGCVVGHGDTLIMPDVFMSIFEGEAELAVVIGKRAKHVSAAHAMEHVFGYVNFIDGSARETCLEREQKGLKGTTPQLTGKYAKL